MAVVSLVFGLLAFLTLLLIIGILPAIIAVISGHLAMSRIRHSQGQLDGYGIAMTGVTLGYITLVVSSLLVLALLFLFQPASRTLASYRQHQSMRNASHLYLAAEAYARDHKDTYPKHWDDLRGRYISTIDLDKFLRSAYSPPFRKSGQPAFQLVPHQRPVLPAITSQVVVIQENAPPEVDLVTVVYADGNTEWIANPNRNSDP